MIGETKNELRPTRNRRYARKRAMSILETQKRLFTPEIKKHLKDWLVRRRENPYPNRDEKKQLATETGLTYIQICNWFANWRRKLKNVNADRYPGNWGHLIRVYNDRAHGNIEQFSLSSDDSIWSESEGSSLTNIAIKADAMDEGFSDMESQDAHVCDDSSEGKTSAVTSPIMLSKWLESAAKFQPSENNYACWAQKRIEPKSFRSANKSHDQAEVEAAVALTALANSIDFL